MQSDLRTKAIVLRRTNYGEFDRILNILTPEGKISVLAKGVRKERSRLAGGIELFSISDIVIHQGKARLGTLTSAKMLQFFGNLLSDMERLEIASDFLKRLERASDQVSSPEHFALLEQILTGLNQGYSGNLVLAWGLLNLARVSGEEVNLIYDINGEKLQQNLRYYWDDAELALRPHPSGGISAREIKFARFLLSQKLSHAARVEGAEVFAPSILSLAKSFS